MISGIGDIQFGIWLTTVGVALIPSTPTVVGGLASAQLIAGGVTEIGLGVSNTSVGLVEFIEHGGLSGLQNELSSYLRTNCLDKCR